MNGKYSRHRPVVLLVEDDPLLRFFVSDLLDDAGFEAIETGRADEALMWLEVRDDVRVIVTDIHMPGPLNGLELAHLVHRRWPGILVLVVSGVAKPNGAELPEGGRFVAKPYEDSTSSPSAGDDRPCALARLPECRLQDAVQTSPA
jgi:two-component system, response regulator PdtaR